MPLFLFLLCRELAAASACGSSWTFLFTFLRLSVTLIRATELKVDGKRALNFVTSKYDNINKIKNS